MRVRILITPLEEQIDGISLAHLIPGTVKDVSTSVGTWLVAQGYAVLEMRSVASTDDFSDNVSSFQDIAHDRRRRPR